MPQLTCRQRWEKEENMNLEEIKNYEIPPAENTRDMFWQNKLYELKDIAIKLAERLDGQAELSVIPLDVLNKFNLFFNAKYHIDLQKVIDRYIKSV